MAGPTREAVYGALFALGQGLSWGSPPVTWAFTMRRVKTPNQLEGMQPALCQAEFSETVEQITRTPQKRTWDCAWFVYFYEGNDDAITSTQANLILDAVDGLFPAEPGRQTLGGLVHSCKVIGRIERYGGNLDGQVLLVVPIQILVP